MCKHVCGCAQRILKKSRSTSIVEQDDNVLTPKSSPSPRPQFRSASEAFAISTLRRCNLARFVR